MPMYMHTNCLLFASGNKLLNNSTFYHLNCPANRDDSYFLGGATLPIPPPPSSQVSPLNVLTNILIKLL
jgi:hypothetical protein